jgi:DnaJ homolog subfamily C member 28
MGFSSVNLCSLPVYRISTSIQVLRTSFVNLSCSSRSYTVDHRASSKLFSDAEREEATTGERRASVGGGGALPGSRVVPEHPNWTGDERIQDAVLRMLVDKYKPLRTGTIQTAEDKIRRLAVPTLSASAPQHSSTSTSETGPPLPPSLSPSPPPPPHRHHNHRIYRADEPLLPAVEGHKPWLTTFKAPSHAKASIHYGQFPARGSDLSSSAGNSSRRSAASSGFAEDDGDRVRRQQREAKKRSEVAGRLTRAKEYTLDYRLGIIKGVKGGAQTQVNPNPVSMKGWAGLVEERIEVCVCVSLFMNTTTPQTNLFFSLVMQRARREGHFRTIKGRGKPLERSVEEHNPFIAREEFLMNRIVQGQGAAPPWVEIQRELEAAVVGFRALLRQSWVRRAVRVLTLTSSSSFSRWSSPSIEDVCALRDREWEARERAYHEAALADVNALVRKYNALAPYAVRRAYYVRDVELRRTYEESGEEILQELRGRQQRPLRESSHGETDDEGELLVVVGEQSSSSSPERLLDLFWRWLRRGRRAH